MKNEIITKIRILVEAHKAGQLGETTMPEDTHPDFKSLEDKRIFYTLPMALNYQRNSYKLWESAKQTYLDIDTADVYNLQDFSEEGIPSLREKLIKHKLALQPNKHIDTWSRISNTIYKNWGSVTKLIEATDSDYLKLKDVIQGRFKKGFPYLSGPKIFNYWMFIMSEYGEVEIKNREFIEIAPDTHVIQASIKLGVISSTEADKPNGDEISRKWRELLLGTEIDPIDVHSPLWFWSRNGFKYEV